jgi:hypothetical protein
METVIKQKPSFSACWWIRRAKVELADQKPNFFEQDLLNLISLK